MESEVEIGLEELQLIGWVEILSSLRSLMSLNYFSGMRILAWDQKLSVAKTFQ